MVRCYGIIVHRDLVSKVWLFQSMQNVCCCFVKIYKIWFNRISFTNTCIVHILILPSLLFICRMVLMSCLHSSLLLLQICLPSTRWKYSDQHCKCSYSCSSFLHPGIPNASCEATGYVVFSYYVNKSINFTWFQSHKSLCRCLFTKITFQFQVLHLMNKMNIPAPFRMALPTPPLPPSVPALQPPPPPPPPAPIAAKPSVADLSSSESEMESSDEVWFPF